MARGSWPRGGGDGDRDGARREEGEPERGRHSHGSSSCCWVLLQMEDDGDRVGGLFVGFCGGVSSLGFRILVYVSLVAKAETGEW
jgi:hypothetical protein